MFRAVKYLLVTGATGYLAANFLNSVQALEAKFYPAYEKIFLLDRNLKLDRINPAVLQNSNVQVIQFDLTEISVNSLFLENLFKKTKGGAELEVIHFAHLNVLEVEKVFVETLRDLADKLDLRLRFMYLSSSAVYGENNSMPLQASQEDDLPEPVSAYGKYKLQVEQYIQSLFQSQKFLILRLANPYGHEFECRGVYQYFRKQLLETASEKYFRVKVNSDEAGQIIRDFIYIDDFSWILLHLFSRNAEGTCNLASQKICFLEDFAAVVKNDLIEAGDLNESLSSKSIQVEYKGFQDGDIKVSHLSIKKMKEYLGELSS